MTSASGLRRCAQGGHVPGPPSRLTVELFLLGVMQRRGTDLSVRRLHSWEKSRPARVGDNKEELGHMKIRIGL